MIISFNLRKTFEILLAIFFVVGTFFYVPAPAGMAVIDAVNFGYQVQELFFRYGVFFFMAFCFLLKPLRSTPVKWESIFIIFLILAACVHGFPNFERRSLLNVIAGVLLIKLTADYVSPYSIKAFAWASFVVITLNIVFCVFQWFRHDLLFAVPANMGHLDLLVGLMRVKAILGTTAAILAPLMIAISPILLLLAMPLLAVGNSSAAVASFVISCAIFAWLKVSKKAFFLISLIVFGLGAFYVLRYDAPGGDFGHRFEVWGMTIERALHTSPIIGNGIGSFAEWLPRTEQANNEPLLWQWAHNEYIQMFYETGIIGLFIILMFVKDILNSFIKYKNCESVQILFLPVLTILLVCIFHFPFHLARMAIPCLICIGLFKANVEAIKNVG